MAWNSYHLLFFLRLSSWLSGSANVGWAQLMSVDFLMHLQSAGVLALGWLGWAGLSWDGLNYDGSSLLHMISQPPAGCPGLDHIAVAGFKKESGSTHWTLRLGTGTLLLLLHSSGQSQSTGQPRFSGFGGERDSNSWWGQLQRLIARGRETAGRERGPWLKPVNLHLKQHVFEP